MSAPAVLALSFLLSPHAFGAVYYVNCASGNDANSGLSASAPWLSLARINSTVFQPGDSILLARGTRCRGELRPHGSGAPGRVITLAAYGTGPLPVINAGANQAAIELSDQSYWEIRSIETTGGDPYGIWITGNTPRTEVRHVHIENVVVHDVTGTPTHTSTGLIVFNLQAKGEKFEDILVDGATVFRTTEWTGIYISGSPFTSPSGTKGENITVRNCTVHDVGGDGIVIHDTRHALIEHSVAYNTGLIQRSSLPTPNAIWNWDCDDCVVQYNEAYRTHTPGNQHDGAAYDSDYYNRNVTIQYNYAHDADGYCVAVFGSGAKDSNVNTIVRYNVCSNDGRNAYLSHQGDFFIHTWNGGSIRHALIYNNTSYWNPAARDAYAVKVDADLDPARPDEFFNNIVYSTVPGFEELDLPASSVWRSDHNVFWYTGKLKPSWRHTGSSYTSLASWSRTTGQDSHSLDADPRLRDPSYHQRGRPGAAFTLLPGSPAAAAGWNTGNLGPRDFFGHPVPRAGAVSSGANQALAK